MGQSQEEDFYPFLVKGLIGRNKESEDRSESGIVCLIRSFLGKDIGVNCPVGPCSLGKV